MNTGRILAGTSKCACLLMISLIFTATALATTYTIDAKAVASGTIFTSLSALLAVTTFKGGDIVKIKPTDIYRDRIKFQIQHSGVPGNPVIIECDAPSRAIWDGAQTDVNAYGYFWTFFNDAHDIEVRRIEVRNVQPGPDLNNRGVYLRGTNISLKDSFIHHNPNGIFSSTEAVNSRIERCEVAFNGIGTGYTHNLYMQGKGTHVLSNYIHDANGGINYKDRSATDPSGGVAIEFSYNWVENASSGGYDLDFSLNSGTPGVKQDAMLIGNVIYKGASSNKTWVMIFGNDGRVGNISLCNNTIIGSSADNALINLGVGSTMKFYNNIFYRGEKLLTTTSGGTVSGSNNWLMTNNAGAGLTGSLKGNWPSFVNYDLEDFRLTPDAPALNAGLATMPLAEVPKFEYVKDATTQARADNGKCIGAFSAKTATVPTTNSTGNIALNRPVTDSSTAHLSGDNSATKIVDGNTTSFWHSELNLLQLEYVQIDLQKLSTITNLEILFRSDVDQSITRKNFAVYASNDPEFRSGVVRLAARAGTAATFNQSWSATVTVTQQFRYVRILKTVLETDTAGNSYLNLAEVKITGNQ